MRPQAASVCGLKLLVYLAGLTLLVYAALSYARVLAMQMGDTDACTRLRDAALEALDISVVLRASRQVLFAQIVARYLLY